MTDTKPISDPDIAKPNGPTEMTPYQGYVYYCLAWGVVGDDQCSRCKLWYELGDEVFHVGGAVNWRNTMCKDCLVKEIW